MNKIKFVNKSDSDTISFLVFIGLVVAIASLIAGCVLSAEEEKAINDTVCGITVHSDEYYVCPPNAKLVQIKNNKIKAKIMCVCPKD